jgi:hypothetical protein
MWGVLGGGLRVEGYKQRCAPLLCRWALFGSPGRRAAYHHSLFPAPVPSIQSPTQGQSPYSPPLTPKSDIIPRRTHQADHDSFGLGGGGPIGGHSGSRPVSLPMRYTQPHQPIPVHPVPTGRGVPLSLPPPLPLPPRPITPGGPAGARARPPAAAAAQREREIVEQPPVVGGAGDGGDGDEEEGKAGGGGEGPVEGEEEEEENIDVDGIDIHPPALLHLEPSGGPALRRPTHADEGVRSPPPPVSTNPAPGHNGNNGNGGKAGAAAVAGAGVGAGVGGEPVGVGVAGGTPHAHLAVPLQAGPRKPGEEEDDLALAGLGIRLNKEGGLLDVGASPSEEARILQHPYHPHRPPLMPHHRGGMGPEVGYGFGVGGRAEDGGGGRGDYGSFSPSTIPVDDRRPQIGARSKAVLEQFFRKPISSEIYGTAFVTLSSLEATAILRQTVTYQRAFEVGGTGVGGWCLGREGWGEIDPPRSSRLSIDTQHIRLCTHPANNNDQLPPYPPITSHFPLPPPPNPTTQSAHTPLIPSHPHNTNHQIIVEEAPLPEDILWRNIDINFVTNYLRTAIGHLLTLSITLAFTFPTAFISGARAEGGG